MGMFWQFLSVEPRRWDALFDGSNPDVKKYLVAAAWDPGRADLPDPDGNPRRFLDALWSIAPPHIARLAEQTAIRGVSYKGLPPEDAELLDAMMVGAFSPEGLEPLLKYREEHHMGLARAAVAELLSRSEPTKIGGAFGIGGRVSVGQPITAAKWLAAGRRFGTSEVPTPENMYLFVERDEVEWLLSDVRGLLAVDRDWKTGEFETACRTELLAPLERIAGAKLHFVARYT